MTSKYMTATEVIYLQEEFKKVNNLKFKKIMKNIQTDVDKRIVKLMKKIICDEIQNCDREN